MEYADETRGEFQYIDRAKQVISYSGMTFGRISPTDIDAMIEYRGKAFVFFEVKHENAAVPQGQLLALTRMADALTEAGKQAIVIVCEHHVQDTSKPVLLKYANVRQYYYNGRWYPNYGSFDRKDVYTTVSRFLETAGGSRP